MLVSTSEIASSQHGARRPEPWSWLEPVAVGSAGLPDFCLFLFVPCLCISVCRSPSVFSHCLVLSLPNSVSLSVSVSLTLKVSPALKSSVPVPRVSPLPPQCGPRPLTSTAGPGSKAEVTAPCAPRASVCLSKVPFRTPCTSSRKLLSSSPRDPASVTDGEGPTGALASPGSLAAPSCPSSTEILNQHAARIFKICNT